MSEHERGEGGVDRVSERVRERSASLHRRILSDCLDRLVEFKMQQGPVMWQ